MVPWIKPVLLFNAILSRAAARRMALIKHRFDKNKNARQKPGIFLEHLYSAGLVFVLATVY